MNDEQFQEDTEALRQGGYVSFVDDIRARDTAQREALARVEAERDTALQQVLDVVERSSDDIVYLKNQLAGAVGLLKDASDPRGPTIRYAAIKDLLARHAQAEQQEVPKQGKPDWSSHGYDQIFQTSDGNWFGARAGWDFKGHISGQWKGREVSLLLDDGEFLAYGEPNPDWESSLEQRPAQEAQGAQASEFQREDRYIVIKRKDWLAVQNSTLPFADDAAAGLWLALRRIQPFLPKRDYLVIESDWPEYEPTWAAIQARVTGQGAQAGDEREAFEAWYRREIDPHQLFRTDSQGAYLNSNCAAHFRPWMARAAIATQSAVPVYLPEANVWDAPSMSADTEPEIAWRDGFNDARDRVMNAVRGAEHE